MKVTNTKKPANVRNFKLMNGVWGLSLNVTQYISKTIECINSPTHFIWHFGRITNQKHQKSIVFIENSHLMKQCSAKTACSRFIEEPPFIRCTLFAYNIKLNKIPKSLYLCSECVRFVEALRMHRENTHWIDATTAIRLICDYFVNIFAGIWSVHRCMCPF